ncbi:MAG: NAD(P)H-hydrate dehydratase [Bdellovibrionaceae bacterium]|nr:NAD(P)H-hydrate dehydratase [Pseudobdellovibrionaceae bacterium]
MIVSKITRVFIKTKIPSREKHSNKTRGGKVLIVGGSEGLLGAGILSALSATRVGAGYTYVMMNWRYNQLLRHPDLLFLAPNSKKLNPTSFDALVFGPGLGQSPTAKKWLTYLIKQKIPLVVLDADGLTLLSGRPPVRLPAHWILTPHTGELARLLAVRSTAIQKDPVKYLLMAQKKWGCHVLLKGPTTYITDGKKIFSSAVGTPALAKAGTGDVLAGIIGGLLAQKLSPLDAAIVGNYIHGLASKQWLDQGNDHLSLRPIDLIEQLPKTLKNLRS